MLVRQLPQVVTTTSRTCSFHEKFPGRQYPGCTCSMSISSRDKRPDEMTESERRAWADPWAGYGEPQA